MVGGVSRVMGGVSGSDSGGAILTTYWSIPVQASLN